MIHFGAGFTSAIEHRTGLGRPALGATPTLSRSEGDAKSRLQSPVVANIAARDAVANQAPQ